MPLLDRRSEHRRRLQKQCVALRGPLAERRRAPLVRHLNRSERRQISVHEYRLDVLPIDSGVGLKEQPQEQILREELVGPKDVNPRALFVRVRVERQALQRIFRRERRRDLMTLEFLGPAPVTIPCV